MMVVNFLEGRTTVLTQLREQIPSVDEQIKVKGRKGIVVSINNLDEKKVNVEIVFEQLVKASSSAIDVKKKKR